MCLFQITLLHPSEKKERNQISLNVSLPIGQIQSDEIDSQGFPGYSSLQEDTF